MTEAARLQAYLRESAHGWAIVVTTPSFDVCLHPADALVYLNYALPRRTVDAVTFAAERAAVEATFDARERVPRFEFVDGASPGFGEVLGAAGYREEPPTTAMTCAPGELRAGIPAGVELRVHDAATPDDEIAAAIRVRDAAFGLYREVNDAALRAYRANAARSPAVVALLDGTLVGVGSLLPVAHGLAEVAGIGVAVEARGRGIGGALTAHLTARAFAAGATRAYLTAADVRATRVYERVGFRPAPYRVRAFVQPGPEPGT